MAASDSILIKEEPGCTRSSVSPEYSGGTGQLTIEVKTESVSIKVKEEPPDTGYSSPPGDHGSAEELITGAHSEATMATSNIICIKTEPYNTSSFISPLHHEKKDELTLDNVKGVAVTASAPCVRKEPKDYCDTRNSCRSYSRLTYSRARPLNRRIPASANSDLQESVLGTIETALFVDQGLEQKEHSVNSSHQMTNCQRKCLEPPEGISFQADEYQLSSITLSDAQHLVIPGAAQRSEKPFKCQACSATFIQSWSFENHKQSCKGEKVFKCEVCPATFKRPLQRRKHMADHTGEKLYQCKYCPAKFSRRTILKCHRLRHTGQKRFFCQLCPASYQRRSGLRYHMMTHTGERPYKCELCPAEFASPGSLRIHVRTHTGEKPFQCELCPAIFSHSSGLRSHMRKHKGEMPYKCKLCPEEFNHLATLKRHMRVHLQKRKN